MVALPAIERGRMVKRPAAAILIAPVMAIGDVGEALAEANSGDYGHCACMVTGDIRRLMPTVRGMGPGWDRSPRRLRRTGAGLALRREEPWPGLRGLPARVKRLSHR